jgi:hypothetical protein
VRRSIAKIHASSSAPRFSGPAVARDTLGNRSIAHTLQRRGILAKGEQGEQRRPRSSPTAEGVEQQVVRSSMSRDGYLQSLHHWSRARRRRIAIH